jgi:hypothetical protein
VCGSRRVVVCVWAELGGCGVPVRYGRCALPPTTLPTRLRSLSTRVISLSTRLARVGRVQEARGGRASRTTECSHVQAGGAY